MYEMLCLNDDEQWMFELSTNIIEVVLDMQQFYEYELGTASCIQEKACIQEDIY